MIFPLLPLLLASLPGAPAAALGVIEGVAEATAAAVKVVSGRLSDRATRRKPLVVAGYAVSSAVRPLVALAAIWPHVLLVRFLDRIGKGVRSAPRDALIAEVTPPERRGAAYGLHRAMDNAGAVAGPLLAAALLGLLALPLRTVLALSVVPAALALLVLVLGVREAPRPEAAASVVRAPAAPLPPAFRRAVAAVALFTLSASSDTFLLLKAREVGVSAAGIPLVWAFSNAIRAALGTWGGGLSDRHGRKRVLFAAWTLYAACYALFGFVKTPLALLVVLAVYSVHAAEDSARPARRPRRLLGPRRALGGGRTGARRRSRPSREPRARLRLVPRSRRARGVPGERRVRPPLDLVRVPDGVPRRGGSRPARGRAASGRRAPADPAVGPVDSASCPDPSGSSSG